MNSLRKVNVPIIKNKNYKQLVLNKDTIVITKVNNMI